MTDEPRAVEGSYSEFQPIKTRGVIKLVVEIPIEKGDEAVRLLGIPQPGNEKRCAVILLNAKPETRKGPAALPPVKPLRMVQL